MKNEYVKELLALTPRQHAVVLGGLVNKLDYQKKTGILSYSYDVCPVCKDVGSTLENSETCKGCYIHKSCQAPFTDGFRDDKNAGVTYFTEMKEVLMSMEFPRTIIVGGNWDADGGKPSGVISKLANELDAEGVYNGGTIDMLSELDIREYDLVVWMPNIANSQVKIYPKKGLGAVLICSKIMRPTYTKADAVTRIFRMRGNAVIQIHRQSTQGRVSFTLTDALGNDWSDTGDVAELTRSILELYRWTKGAIRFRSIQDDTPTEQLERLMACAREVADSVENSIGSRYFGNISTRCQRMFPGMRARYNILISPRNTDKRRLEAEDMVLVSDVPGEVHFLGTRKPSVDTPIQVALFNLLSNVNFFVHGHAKVADAPMTENYFPCGDYREVTETKELIDSSANTFGAINLKNHGFLLYSKTIEEMEELVQSLEFEAPN